jgi:hypothetical protein
MLSGSPETAKPLPNRNVPGTKLSSAIVSVECSVAIDPIKNVGVALSLDDLEPDNDIVDEDGMPGKPSLPACPVLGSYSHVMILSFGSQLKRTESPVSGIVQIKFLSLIFSFRTVPDIAPRTTRAMPPCVTWPPAWRVIITVRLSRRQAFFAATAEESRCFQSAASPHLPRRRMVRDVSRRLSTSPDSISSPS